MTEALNVATAVDVVVVASLPCFAALKHHLFQQLTLQLSALLAQQKLFAR
jgi:hypothetical protein